MHWKFYSEGFSIFRSKYFPLTFSVFRLSRTPVDAATNTRIGANIRSSRYPDPPRPRGSGSSAGTVEDQLKRKKKKRKKKEEVQYDYNNDDDQSKVDIIPIFCAVTIASILGGPVCLVANLKGRVHYIRLGNTFFGLFWTLLDSFKDLFRVFYILMTLEKLSKGGQKVRTQSRLLPGE